VITVEAFYVITVEAFYMITVEAFYMITVDMCRRPPKTLRAERGTSSPA
jgi:hypothetical protein